MPGKNIIKTYQENGYYHLYNRGVDKREIFMDEQDCKMFLYFFKIYLSPPLLLQAEANKNPRLLFKILNRNLHLEVSLLSFALMPNHFHIQAKQIVSNGIEKLMRRVITSYVQYFNRKYNRRGPLFENIYRAVATETEEQHLYLSAYIHRNAMELHHKIDFMQFSSYPYYLGYKHAPWIDTSDVLSYFSRAKSIGKVDMLSYQGFVENLSGESLSLIENSIIDEE